MMMKTQKITRLLLTLAVCLVLSPVSGPVASVSASEAEENHVKSIEAQYLIGMGDVLEVSVWNEPEMSKTVFVRMDGKIALPLIGDVEASDKSPEALARLLQEKFGNYLEEPSVIVILQESKSKRYYVLGQVAEPGEFAMDYSITILQAIGRAGGFLEWAKKSKILIVRRRGEKEEILNFDYNILIKGGGLRQNVLVKPGDTIVVP